jgi:hypothetical protein
MLQYLQDSSQLWYLGARGSTLHMDSSFQPTVLFQRTRRFTRFPGALAHLFYYYGMISPVILEFSQTKSLLYFCKSLCLEGLFAKLY